MSDPFNGFVKQRGTTLRRSGREYVVKFPTEVADTHGLVPRDKVEVWANPKGEVLIRPVKIAEGVLP